MIRNIALAALAMASVTLSGRALAQGGCSDGEREGFVDEGSHPSIAGCSGGWTVPGVISTTSPACFLTAGDDSVNSLGTGCSVADLCAPGWHVCEGPTDVMDSSGTGTCSGATVSGDPELFFATRQSGAGSGGCGAGNNDIFGCGNLGSTPAGTCSPLDRFSQNLCSSLGAPWSCGADGFEEANNVIKTGTTRGGVLCCRDASVCGDGFRASDEECDDGNMMAGDGCSDLCAVEPGFLCEDVSFRLDTVEEHDGTDIHSESPIWIVDGDNRGVRQTQNAKPAIYGTTMLADVADIQFELSVAETGGDDDFIGWTVGFDSGELSASGTAGDRDFLLFNWKQGTQTVNGTPRAAGLWLTRVTGPVSQGNLWGSTGNANFVAQAGGGFGTAGWADNLIYRIRMRFSPGRVRVWIASETAVGAGTFNAEVEVFDLVGPWPTGAFGFYSFSQPQERYRLLTPIADNVCAPDYDNDGVKDQSDLDSDRDGIADLDEMLGFTDDPDVDSDLDGVPDWQDPDNFPGGCADGDTNGVCDSLPADADFDGDGIPNHLDYDSDGDGVTDGAEAGLTDVDGDGIIDDCTTVDTDGVCDSGALAGPAPDADMADGPDFLDTDADGDSIPDSVEAFDTDGDQMADTLAVMVDTDLDGIDDAFDPDCSMAAPCGAVIGVVAPDTDSDADGSPNRVQVCRDGYLTGAEICDDGDMDDTNACSNACLFGNGEGCTDSAECDSMICDPALMTCQPCSDVGPGTDPGCTMMIPACVTSMGTSSCQACTDDSMVIDSGCDAMSPICDESTVTCVACSDTAGPGLRDEGCPAPTPICDTSGAPTCVGCAIDADCSGGVCDGGSCTSCVDDQTGASTDRGCTMMAPICDGGLECQACLDDTSGGVDLGCDADAPACSTSSSTHVCASCEDTAADAMIDNGCDATTPVCNTTGTPTCVECTSDSHCGAGTVCDLNGSCVPGCNTDADCSATPQTPICNVPSRICVECIDDSVCSGTQTCGATGRCEFDDSDGDGVADDLDLDDDNDGIPDDEELDSSLTGDSDGDGVLDYQDPDSVTCTESGGICTDLPPEVDSDQDGVPNHLDLDTDGDGIADITEAGGDDADRDGLADDFTDANGDGLDDRLVGNPLPLPDTDSSGSPDFLDIDADGDGLPDTFEAGGTDDDLNGMPDGTFTDANGDGLDDRFTGLGALPLTNTDNAGREDYRSIDSDGDRIGDLVEAHVGDGVGATPAGSDTDGDGLDDAFDPDCIDDLCGGTVGTIASLPDTDSDGLVDFRDIDSDGDGISDEIECPSPAMCENSDAMGAADFLELDADGDSLPDSVEGHDADFDEVADVDPAGADTDGDGLDDAFDPDCIDAADCAGVIGVPSPAPDLDMDGRPNFQDPDDDGDGRLSQTERTDADEYEGPAADSTDIDEDGRVNWLDTDSDGDDSSDMTENAASESGDADDNGILDYLDPTFSPVDTDGDSVPDSIECTNPQACEDTDGDGVPDVEDVDDDNDGILTRIEWAAVDPEDGDPTNDHDFDNDGIPNHLDLDADGDGIPDVRENDGFDLDADGDGVVDDPVDADGDGLLAAFDDDDSDPLVVSARPERNTDGLAGPDNLDLDADNDGLTDVFEAEGEDADNDGLLDASGDADGDGLADEVDPDSDGSPLSAPDTDDDGDRDFQDTDSDNDGAPDLTEGRDDDANGRPDVDASGADMNGDGVDDAFQPGQGGTAASIPDHDDDGEPDWRDTDDDGDGILTRFEDVNADGDPRNDDSDRDGMPDYLDPDDDNDGVDTEHENPDPNGDGNPDDAVDTDGDGVPDYRDDDDDGDGVPTRDEDPDPNGDGDPDDAPDSDGDGVPDYLDNDSFPSSGGGYAGGACAAGGSSRQALPLLLAMLILAFRRRKSTP